MFSGSDIVRASLPVRFSPSRDFRARETRRRKSHVAHYFRNYLRSINYNRANLARMHNFATRVRNNGGALLLPSLPESNGIKSSIRSKWRAQKEKKMGDELFAINPRYSSSRGNRLRMKWQILRARTTILQPRESPSARAFFCSRPVRLIIHLLARIRTRRELYRTHSTCRCFACGRVCYFLILFFFYFFFYFY